MYLTEILSSRKKLIRLAGVVYLLLVLSGIFSLLYVPGQLIDWNDPGQTVSNLQDSTSLFQWGITVRILSNIFFLFLPLILYKLLRHVDKNAATVMFILTLVSVAISFSNMTNHFGVLSLLSEPDYLSHLSSIELQTEIMSLLGQYDNGILVSHIFWGLWLFPFGYLVYNSGFLPRFLGIALMLGCFGYLIDFAGYSFFKGYGESILSEVVGIPSAVGEIGICLWMLLAPLTHVIHDYSIPKPN